MSKSFLGGLLLGLLLGLMLIYAVVGRYDYEIHSINFFPFAFRTDKWTGTLAVRYILNETETAEEQKVKWVEIRESYQE